ncbi:hypothetical protein DIZ27_32155 [Streptomyces sp. NWU339]|nr:hypothetical protein DIZ27_32155 [Streptomyces sp. NWU339]
MVPERLPFTLPGAQLGITVCTPSLSSVSKPAISHQLDPLSRWTERPQPSMWRAQPRAFSMRRSSRTTRSRSGAEGTDSLRSVPLPSVPSLSLDPPTCSEGDLLIVL